MSRTMTISSWSASNCTSQMVVRRLVQAGEDLFVHAGHAARRVEQTVAVGVLTDGGQDLADGRLDAGQVDGTELGIVGRDLASAPLERIGAGSSNGGRSIDRR